MGWGCWGEGLRVDQALGGSNAAPAVLKDDAITVTAAAHQTLGVVRRVPAGRLPLLSTFRFSRACRPYLPWLSLLEVLTPLLHQLTAFLGEVYTENYGKIVTW